MEKSFEEFKGKLGGFGEFTAEIGKLVPEWSERRDCNGALRRQIDFIEHEDQPFYATPRFLKSLNRRFGISNKTYNYFTPEEVFGRVQELHPKTEVRVVHDGDDLLAVSNPIRAYVNAEALCDVLTGLTATPCENLLYSKGVVRTTHRMKDAGWEIGGDFFAQTFTLSTPIDGYGLPSIYLSMLRQVCENGLIAHAPTFRSEIQTGTKDDRPEIPLGRALRSFNNEEGYQALRQRMESARSTLASVHEVQGLKKAVEHACRDDIDDEDLLRIDSRMSRKTGDVVRIYNVASPEAITAKRQHLLKMRCSVYDLFNMATEMTSHHRGLLADSSPIHAWVGTTIASEYDLEGGKFDVPAAQPLYMNN